MFIFVPNKKDSQPSEGTMSGKSGHAFFKSCILSSALITEIFKITNYREIKFKSSQDFESMKQTFPIFYHILIINKFLQCKSNIHWRFSLQQAKHLFIYINAFICRSAVTGICFPPSNPPKCVAQLLGSAYSSKTISMIHIWRAVEAPRLSQRSRARFPSVLLSAYPPTALS